MIVVICFAVVMPLVIVCVIVIATYRGFLQNPDQAFERTPYRPIVWDMWAKPSRGRSFERPIGFLKKTPRGLCPHVFAGLDPLRGSCGHGAYRLKNPCASSRGAFKTAHIFLFRICWKRADCWTWAVNSSGLTCCGNRSGQDLRTRTELFVWISVVFCSCLYKIKVFCSCLYKIKFCARQNLLVFQPPKIAHLSLGTNDTKKNEQNPYSWTCWDW